jgi:hypothetical protein
MREPEWQDQEGNRTEAGLVGVGLKLVVKCNEEMEEGAGVTFRIYLEGTDSKRDQAEKEIASVNHGGKAEAEWTYHYKYDPDAPLTEKPKYFFTVNGLRCKEVKSGNVEIGMDIDIPAYFNDGELVEGLSYTLIGVDESEEKGITEKSGRIEHAALIPGDYTLIIDGEQYTPPQEKNRVIELETLSESCKTIHGNIGEVFEFRLHPEQEYVMIINRGKYTYSV